MEPRSLPKDSAFLSRPRQGEDFATYKNRMLDTFEANGWLSPEDGEEKQLPREGQTEDLTYKEDSNLPPQTEQPEPDLNEPMGKKIPVVPPYPSKEFDQLYNELM